MRSRIQSLVPAALALMALIATGSACRPPAAPPAATEVQVAWRPAPSLDPTDAAWQDVPELVAPLLLQDQVEPRTLALSTREVRVRATSDGTRLAVRLEWLDPTRDDELRPGAFGDACALQLPARVQPDVPAPQMGEAGKPVEITFWRAAWQAVVDGRAPTLEALYPNASVDHYPFEGTGEGTGESTGESASVAEAATHRELALLYSPATALGNTMAAPPRAVQELVATGPGTLAPAGTAEADGLGRRTAEGWAVVLTRPLPSGLAESGRTQIAFAVWEGTHGEAGALKMRTAWVPLALEARP